MIEALSYTFMQKALFAGILVALSCSLVGVFVVLRRLSPIGDGLAHISFGAIAIGIVAGIYPLGAALLACIISVLGIQYLQKKGVYGEVGISVFYATGLALGIVILSKTKSISVDLFSYLFGSILSVSTQDLILMVVLAIIVIGFTLALSRQLFSICFDANAARVSGIRVSFIETIFSLLLAITIVVAIKVVGIMLVSALVVIPAASAINVASSTRQSLVLAALFGAVSVIVGTLLAYYVDASAAGIIILCQVCLFAISVAFKK